MKLSDQFVHLFTKAPIATTLLLLVSMGAGVLLRVAIKPEPAPLVWFQVVADDGVILGEFLAPDQVQAERGAHTWLGGYDFREHYEVRPKPRAGR